MKKYLIIFLLMFNHFIGYTQLNDTNIIHKNKPVVFDKSYYTQKAHNANKSAWLLLAGGVFIELVANLSYNKRQTEDVYTDGNLTITSADRKAIILNWQTVIGALPILASIPFFISSMHYKAKAKKVVVP